MYFICELLVGCQVSALSTGLDVTGCSVGATVAAGEMCTYSCMSGYTLNGDSEVTCGSAGTFSPTVPTCDGKRLT